MFFHVCLEADFLWYVFGDVFWNLAVLHRSLIPIDLLFTSFFY